MLFQSWKFVLFFAGFYLVYLWLKKTKLRNLWIVAGSYAFYMFLEPWFAVLLAYATCVDHFVVWRMDRGKGRKVWLWVSIVNSVLLLGFFKYSNFAVENVNALLEAFGAGFYLSMPSILLPVGLSFYLFKSIGYVVDVYRGDVERETDFVRYAAFVSFFPLLLSGPIERAGNLLRQLKEVPEVKSRNVTDGLSLFLVGLFKKVALADMLAVYVNEVYSEPGAYKSVALLAATFVYSWQLYFDFSGYSDMARGISEMMGYRVRLNFNNPYLATGLGDFWRRWHISLSTWFRDYLYIPLGGNRKGKGKTYRNVVLTMMVMGLWHGAAWTFVVWGAVHAGMRCWTRNLEASEFCKERVPVFVKRVMVFLFVTLAWVIFRAESLSDAGLIFTRIFTTGLSDPAVPLLFMGVIALVWGYQFLYESKIKNLLELRAVKIVCAVAMLMYLLMFTSPGGQEFIYFRF